MRLFLAIATPLLLLPLACAGAGGLSGAGVTKKAASAKNQDDDGPDREDDAANKPQEVSGAFLTCGPDTAAGGDGFGCAFKSSDGKKLGGAVTNPAVIVTLADGTKITPAATAADQSSPWHVTFSLPAGTAATVVSVELECKLGDAAVDGETDNLQNRPGNALGSSQAGVASGTGTGTGAGAAATTPEAQVVFLTRGVWQPGRVGDRLFESAAIADAYCMAAAQASAKMSTVSAKWVAILSTAAAPAKTRVTIKGPVVNAGGAQVAATAADFWGPHKAPMDIDEAGLTVANAPVWTGTATDGSPSPNGNCNDWADGNPDFLDSIPDGAQGNASDPSNWATAAVHACGVFDPSGAQDPQYRAHLYCLSQ